jgi:hypothetical protein
MEGSDMSLKLKVLGLGLLAVMATSVFGVMNAGAVFGGHFVHHGVDPHATISGVESTGSIHKLEFVKEGGAASEVISCHNASYTGTVTANTFQSVTITPAWSNCTTGTPETEPSFEVDENGCDFTFTSGKTGSTHHTAILTCPVGKSIEITHPNCTIRIPAQTLSAVTYTAITEGGKNALTMNVTAKPITSHYEAGICIFLGTTQKSEMKGSVTIKATDTLGAQVNLTHTTGA